MKRGVAVALDEQECAPAGQGVPVHGTSGFLCASPLPRPIELQPPASCTRGKDYFLASSNLVLYN